MYTPQETLRIQELRQKVLANEVTKEQLAEGLALLRKGREGAHATSATARTRTATAKKSIDSGSLLNELDGLN